MQEKNPYQKHPTVYLEELDAHIDVLCVPMVRWINTLPHTYTMFSCQGGPPEPKLRDNGNIVFCTKNLESLITVLSKFRKLGLVNTNWTQLSYSDLMIEPRFVIEFEHENLLKYYEEF